MSSLFVKLDTRPSRGGESPSAFPYDRDDRQFQNYPLECECRTYLRKSSELRDIKLSLRSSHGRVDKQGDGRFLPSIDLYKSI